MTAPPVPAPGDPLVAMMDDITAVFENGTAAPQYAYVENLHDGCGYTAGWLGFCTATGDLLNLVTQYNAAVPDNALARYTDTLHTLADAHSDDTAGLGTAFEADWKQAAEDPRFVRLQLQVGHDTYLVPARRYAAREGVATNLGLENFFDTALMMGPGENDCDGLPEIVRETDAAMHGSPASGVAEASWLTAFNQIRVRHLRKPCTPGRENDWPQAVGRSRALQELADQGRWDLTAAITIGGGFDVTITEPHD
jgi:chitosanase